MFVHAPHVRVHHLFIQQSDARRPRGRARALVHGADDGVEGQLSAITRSSTVSRPLRLKNKTMALRPAARIAPSMLSSDFSNLSSEAARMVALGADWLHMDVMVRCYARELSLLPSPLISCFLYCLFVLLEGLVVSG